MPSDQDAIAAGFVASFVVASTAEVVVIAMLEVVAPSQIGCCSSYCGHVHDSCCYVLCHGLCFDCYDSYPDCIVVVADLRDCC
ncbi:hypothetical protein DY000_02051901 [Brassica cretica]|uniref:Secreted protein n=1 Tax=Brassica cretica TaxID=69181 RepID=A0ABQ7AFK1_BRACR|nr:hypothetical protein DY000_02051901 [Brassica cretica]